MRIARFWTPQPLAPGRLLTLEPGPSRHLTQVLRLRAGDELVLFNGDGHDYDCRIQSPNRDGARIRIGAPGPVEAPATLRITLALGVAKGERMDFALQKAVELGVCAVQPLFTERSVVRLRDARLQKRLEHWYGVVVSGCEQSGRRRLPTLAAPLRLSEWLDRLTAGGLLLDHRSDLALPALRCPVDGKVVLLVGPEGGLAPKERQAAQRAGFVGVRLGPRVMRTETAPLAAIAALQTLWGDFRP